MKNQILILLALAIFTGTETAAVSATQKYTCVMHPEVVMDAPGKCPKCGMTLVPMKEERKRPTPNAQPPMSNEEHHTTATHEMHAMPPNEMSMHSSVNVAEPMRRESSGTSWVPDST